MIQFVLRSLHPSPGWFRKSIPQAATAVVLVAAFFGCTTTKVSSSDGRPLPPAPRDARVAPAGAAPDRMAFFVASKPDDTNRNGYPDLIKTSVSLFSSDYPMSLSVDDGQFEFTLFPQGTATEPGAQPIASWRFSGQQVASARASAQYGPCYFFRLSLVESGSEKLPFDRADLLCSFSQLSADSPIKSDGVRTIQVGRRSATARP